MSIPRGRKNHPRRSVGTKDPRARPTGPRKPRLVIGSSTESWLPQGDDSTLTVTPKRSPGDQCYPPRPSTPPPGSASRCIGRALAIVPPRPPRSQAGDRQGSRMSPTRVARRGSRESSLGPSCAQLPAVREARGRDLRGPAQQPEIGSGRAHPDHADLQQELISLTAAITWAWPSTTACTLSSFRNDMALKSAAAVPTRKTSARGIAGRSRLEISHVTRNQW